MASKTYYIGSRLGTNGPTANIIKRLDDFTGPWVDLSANFYNACQFNPNDPPYTSLLLQDVKTLPGDPSYVFVCGPAKGASSFKGIAYSKDAGVTWILPGITPDLSSGSGIFYEMSIVEYVSGGNTYVKVFACSTIVTTLPIGGVYVWDSQVSAQPAFVQSSVSPPGLQNEPVTSINFKTHLEGVIGLGSGIGSSLSRVMKTNDGGGTWLPTTSVALSNNIASKYRQVGVFRDGNLIIAMNYSTILKSTDGGSTWTQVYCFGGNVCNFSATPITTGVHLTWNIDATGARKFWATGSNNEIVVSTDNGSTWSVFNSHSYSTIAPPSPWPRWFAACFHTPSNGFIGSVGTTSLPNDLNINVFEVLGSTESISDTELASGEGDIVISAIWTNYQSPQCYKLMDCAGILADLYTQNDMSQYVGNIVTNINIGETPSLSCWEVFDQEPCNQNDPVSIGLADVEVFSGQNACIECTTECYTLIECEAPYTETVIFAPSDLNFDQYIYQTIQSDFCPGKCLYVVKSESCEGAVELPADVEITSFKNCFECRGIPPPQDLHPRRIKPGFYTPGCPPEYTVKTSCMYGEQVYDEMVAVRYGITICCDHDVDKWDIKMQLLQLKALYDDCLCISAATTSCPCTEPCNVAGVATAYITQVPVDPDPPCIPPTRPDITIDNIELCYSIPYIDQTSSLIFTFVREITMYDGNTFNITSLITVPVTSPLFPAQMVAAIQSLGYQCSGVYVGAVGLNLPAIYIFGINGYVQSLTFQNTNGAEPVAEIYETPAEVTECFEPDPLADCYEVIYAFGQFEGSTMRLLSLTFNNGTTNTQYDLLPFTNINVGPFPDEAAVEAYINGIPGYHVDSVIITNVSAFTYRMRLVNFTGGYPVGLYPSIPAIVFPSPPFQQPGYYFYNNPSC